MDWFGDVKSFHRIHGTIVYIHIHEWLVCIHTYMNLLFINIGFAVIKLSFCSEDFPIPSMYGSLYLHERLICMVNVYINIPVPWILLGLADLGIKRMW